MYFNINHFIIFNKKLKIIVFLVILIFKKFLLKIMPQIILNIKNTRKIKFKCIIIFSVNLHNNTMQNSFKKKKFEILNYIKHISKIKNIIDMQ